MKILCVFSIILGLSLGSSAKAQDSDTYRMYSGKVKLNGEQVNLSIRIKETPSQILTAKPGTTAGGVPYPTEVRVFEGRVYENAKYCDHSILTYASMTRTETCSGFSILIDDRKKPDLISILSEKQIEVSLVNSQNGETSGPFPLLLEYTQAGVHEGSIDQ